MGKVYFVSEGHHQVSVARVGGKSLLTLMSSSEKSKKDAVNSAVTMAISLLIIEE